MKKYSLKNTLISFFIGCLVLTISFFKIHIAFIDIMAGFITFLIVRMWLSSDS